MGVVQKKYEIGNVYELYGYLRDRVWHYGRMGEPLEDLDPTTAFQLGAETVLHELREAISPDPKEVGIIFIKGEAE